MVCPHTHLITLKNKKLRVGIIQLYYDILVAEHRKRWNMMKLVTRNCQWLEVIRNVGKYINDSDLYQRIKNRIEVPTGKLK